MQQVTWGIAVCPQNLNLMDDKQLSNCFANKTKVVIKLFETDIYVYISASLFYSCGIFHRTYQLVLSICRSPTEYTFILIRFANLDGLVLLSSAPLRRQLGWHGYYFDAADRSVVYNHSAALLTNNNNNNNVKFVLAMMPHRHTIS